MMQKTAHLKKRWRWTWIRFKISKSQGKCRSLWGISKYHGRRKKLGSPKVGKMIDDQIASYQASKAEVESFNTAEFVSRTWCVLSRRMEEDKAAYSSPFNIIDPMHLPSVLKVFSNRLIQIYPEMVNKSKLLSSPSRITAPGFLRNRIGSLLETRTTCDRGIRFVLSRTARQCGDWLSCFNESKF